MCADDVGIKLHSLTLPEKTSLQRSLRCPYQQNGESFSEDDLRNYDFTTLFYDVFFDTSNRMLYTVGPPFLNLRRELFPITCRVNGKKRRYGYREYFNHRIGIGAVRLPRAAVQSMNTVSFRFGNGFSKTVKVPLNTEPPSPRILTAIQKNNRPRWIADWAAFYREKYAVDRVIIYDNGSDTVDEIKNLARQHSYISIVPWDFPYGTYRNSGNKFCQIGALNHCRLRFGRSSVIFNFDVDELLHYSSKKIDMHMKYGKMLSFGQYYVPVAEAPGEEYSFDDFSLRESQKREIHRKYIFRSDRILVNFVHTARTKPNNAVMVLEKMAEKIYTNIVQFLSEKKMNRVLSAVKKVYPLLPYKKIHDGWFLHYRGITTGWKKELKRLEATSRERADYLPIESDEGVG
ncbi:MAG: glycosyltransferase family 2 protein [Fibrobacterota bacterium]